MDTVAAGQKLALLIDSNDNVVVALTDIKKGDICSVMLGEGVTLIKALEDISFGHKIALSDIAKSEKVLKYGEEIGRMNEAIEKGGWVHNHNMYCNRGQKE